MARDISDEEKERINKGIDPKAARKRLADKGTESGGSLAGPLGMLEKKLDKPLIEQDERTRTGKLDPYDGKILLEDMAEKGPLSAGLMRKSQGMQSGVAYPTNKPLPRSLAGQAPEDTNRPQFDSVGDMFSNMFSKK